MRDVLDGVACDPAFHARDRLLKAQPVAHERIANLIDGRVFRCGGGRRSVGAEPDHNARLLECFSECCEVIGDRWWVTVVLEAIARRIGIQVIQQRDDPGEGVGVVDTAPGEDVRTRHESGLPAPAHEEHFHATLTVPKQDDGRRRPRRYRHVGRIFDRLGEALRELLEGDDELIVRGQRPAAIPSLRGSDPAAQPRGSRRMACPPPNATPSGSRSS